MKSTEDNNGQTSSMRISLYWVVAMTALGFLTMCAVLIIRATAELEINWLGASAFVAALGAFLWQAFKNKVDQKKVELNQAK